MSRNIVMVWHHDLGLVVLSILMSILAACAARELAGRIDLRCHRFGEPAGYGPDSL